MQWKKMTTHTHAQYTSMNLLEGTQCTATAVLTHPTTIGHTTQLGTSSSASTPTVPRHLLPPATVPDMLLYCSTLTLKTMALQQPFSHLVISRRQELAEPDQCCSPCAVAPPVQVLQLLLPPPLLFVFQFQSVHQGAVLMAQTGTRAGRRLLSLWLVKQACGHKAFVLVL